MESATAASRRRQRVAQPTDRAHGGAPLRARAENGSEKVNAAGKICCGAQKQWSLGDKSQPSFGSDLHSYWQQGPSATYTRPIRQTSSFVKQ
jgi:hypothetical protein